MLKEFINKNKTFIIIYSILLIIGIGGIIFSYNNYSLYKQPIAKIDSITEEHIATEELSYGFKEEVYNQYIKATIMNGEDKGKEITIKNEYHQSEAYDQKYKVNDELIVSLNKRDNTIINSRIEGYKRDKYLITAAIILILVIILVGKIKGLLSIISVIINILLFYLIINLNAKGISLVLLSYLGALLFSIICLLLVAGFNKKSLAAITSSIISVTITMLISLIVIKFTNFEGIRFEQMELLTRPYEGIYIAELILGGLGAIMDISITMASSLNELIDKDDKISIQALTKSGTEIGKDVMGTMINVLFFTYICSVIPNLAIYFRNGFNMGILMREYISLEMSRALVGAIGIVIAIPISISICLLFYKRRLKK